MSLKGYRSYYLAHALPPVDEAIAAIKQILSE